MTPEQKNALSALLLGVLVLLGAAGAIVAAVMRSGFGLADVDQAMRWFDPWFFQYNLWLTLFSILIVPFITFHYVASMRGEKIRRLQREWCERTSPPVLGATPAACAAEVAELVAPQFKMRRYVPSVVAMMLVSGLGVAVLLLAKPSFTGNGIDYSRGANMLLLGPYLRGHEQGDARAYQQVIIALCAFQFGFLGAYVYAISALIRSYFTVDLTPHTIVAGTVRMVTASVLSIVLSFFIMTLPQVAEPTLLQMLPVLSFFLGYFPSRALLVLERAGRVLLEQRTRYEATPMHSLPGMTIGDELRLDYEGLDSLEDLEHSDPADLAIRTGFTYSQLRDWRDQAWLGSRLRDDYPKWLAGTAILGRQELREYFEKQAARIDEAIADLADLAQIKPGKVRALFVALSGTPGVPVPRLRIRKEPAAAQTRPAPPPGSTADL